MTLRTEAGTTYTQTWDVDNRLLQVTRGAQTTQFAYDGDGKRVLQRLPDGTQIAYVGGIEAPITSTQRISKTYYATGATLRLGSGQALIERPAVTGRPAQRAPYLTYAYDSL